MTLTTDQLREILPQSYPFLLIDKVIEYKENEHLTAIKNITANEWCFRGALSQGRVFPEALILEAAAQATIILYHVSKNQNGEPIPTYILGRINAEFSKQVFVGEQLRIDAFARKMLYDQGYMDVNILADRLDTARVRILYQVRR